MDRRSDDDVARAAILDVLSTGLRCADLPDADGFAACFAPDAVWHQGPVTYRGRSSIRGVVAERRSDRVVRHLLGPTRFVELAGEHAVVESHAAIVTSDDPGVRVVDYRDELRRVDGGWQITERRTETVIG